jgi:ArsR family transcriptional regulator
LHQLINFFKLLSDETRLRIMVLLSEHHFCVCQLCGILDLPQPNVSKHLGKLRDLGFVKDERREQFIFYYLNIENPLFKNVLRDITTNIDDYPVLKQDLERSREAEYYVEMARAALKQQS